MGKLKSFFVSSCLPRCRNTSLTKSSSHNGPQNTNHAGSVQGFYQRITRFPNKTGSLTMPCNNQLTTKSQNKGPETLRDKNREAAQPMSISMDWFKGTFTGNPQISWENLWFPVDVPLNIVETNPMSTAPGVFAMFAITFKARRPQMSLGRSHHRVMVVSPLILRRRAIHKRIHWEVNKPYELDS